MAIKEFTESEIRRLERYLKELTPVNTQGLWSRLTQTSAIHGKRSYSKLKWLEYSDIPITISKERKSFCGFQSVSCTATRIDNDSERNDLTNEVTAMLTRAMAEKIDRAISRAFTKETFDYDCRTGVLRLTNSFAVCESNIT